MTILDLILLGVIAVLVWLLRESDRLRYMKTAEWVGVDARCHDLEQAARREEDAVALRLALLTETHDREIARVDARHADERRYWHEELEHMGARWGTDRKLLIETLTFGSPAREAIHEAAPPSVEERVEQSINNDLIEASRILEEQAIQRGMEVLKEEYRKQDLAISDEEARLQATAMLQGRSPVQ